MTAEGRPLVTGSASTARRGLFAHRNFRLLLVGETVSKFGTSITSVLLPLTAVVTLDASPALVGLLTAAPWLPWLVVGLPAGAWVDRWPRRRVMHVCNLASAALFASVPAAWWLRVLTFWQLLLVAFLTGIASVFFSTAYSSCLPALVERSELLEGNTKLQGGEHLAQIAGPGAGGLLAQLLGTVPGLLLDSVSFLVSSWCLRRIRADEPRRSGERVRLREEMSTGLRFIGRDPLLRAVIAFGAAANLALAGYEATYIVFLVRSVGLGAGAVGLLGSCGAVGGVLGVLCARRIAGRWGTARGLVAAQLVSSVFGLLIPLTAPGPRLALFVIGSTVTMAGLVACNVITVSFRQSYCPEDLLGRVTSTALLINFSTVPLGAVAAGALNSAVGPRPTMWIVAGALVAAVLPLLAAPLRGLRDLTGVKSL
ncbi:MFS transporter [Streptomyces sp. SID8366]|uniref:MFS transporter n=1 Tax=unclassified Streptomyces TaxID=2593676 RepID=UPI000DB92568|nr:MFS transporter [Streptomyces sp. PsTaAH-130]MYU07839.1 MFS transporter [Streptomyces sp. SID8366]MYU67357.1 MFS transporter [Streptomyces sp. SID69]RAJ52180.1 putative MFS family arabinose efflux permease [Streptomyces sp. PsTaAH-130]